MNCVLQDPAYSRLKEHLIASTGLDFCANREEELAGLIGRRLADLRLRDCASYAEFLAGAGSAEMDVLIEGLTVGETYFFRDPEQFTALRDVVIPDILERKRSSRRLRIWSAGCAIGAEPYSMAILLMHEMADRMAGWQVAIEATDLNRNYLAQAAAGKFREWTLRAVSAAVKRECFTNEGRNWTIDPRFRQWISFRHMNLAGDGISAPWNAAAEFDLILCRNVMIYFAPKACRHLIGRLHRSLGDGGWLVVGATESSEENFRAFRTVNVAGASVHQKAAPERRAHPQSQTKTAPAEPLPMVAGAPDAADEEGLRRLADRGDWQSAAEYVKKLPEGDRLNPAIHFYRALIFENLGIADEAERWLRQAIYLDRGFAMAHYHLGLRLKKDGQPNLAARSFRNVVSVLAGRPGDETVPAGDGVTAARMTELARMNLEDKSGF